MIEVTSKCILDMVVEQTRNLRGLGMYLGRLLEGPDLATEEQKENSLGYDCL